jgi:molybdopterin-guanine dinucleotide biosynthesis protein A
MHREMSVEMVMHEGLRLPVYILAGGMSSRFGSDKARAELQGEPLLARLARLVEPVASSIAVVAKAEGGYADLGFRTIADTYQNAGPLAGIHAALSDQQESSREGSEAEWVLVLSCDLVEFKPGWCRLLSQHINQSRHAVAFRHEKWEPLLGLYRVDLLESVESRLEKGHCSAQRFLDEIDAVAVGVPESWPSILQVNTPDELWQFQARK